MRTGRCGTAGMTALRPLWYVKSTRRINRLSKTQFKLGQSLINKPCGNLPSLDHLSNVIIYRILLNPTLAGATVLAFRM